MLVGCAGGGPEALTCVDRRGKVDHSTRRSSGRQYLSSTLLASHIRRASIANEQQFKLSTRFVATRGVREFRESIRAWVKPTDSVLEIGCEWGTTTREIADVTPRVLGTDISPKVIDRAREMHPQIEFAVLDAFDVRAAAELGDFSKVYIDMSGLSGYRSLLDVIALLTMYGTVLRPDAIVIKSGALKHFATHCVAWSQPRGDGSDAS